jgi:uncharacterized protein
MRIAIIADIHDNIVNLEKFIFWSKQNKIDGIICAGDVTNADTLQYLANEFSGDIYLVRGNMEIYEEKEIKKYKNIKYLGRYGVAEIDKKFVGLCHEPFFADNLLKENKCELIFCGHTHKPWIEEKKGVKILNPGTLSGTFQRATFAIWDTESAKIELNLLELI